MIITMDIETIGTENPDAIADLAKGITPPGNISKAETIAAWEADKKPGLIEEVVKKTSFDGGLGRIVCIGWAINDGEPECAYHDPSLSTDATIVSAFFTAIKEAVKIHYHGGDTKETPVFIGHNISGFDLRFLWQRAVVNKLKPPSAIPFNVKPWEKSIADTMLMWNPEREKRTSLDKLCRILGVPTSKGGMDGGMVWDYYKAGRFAEIAEYCKGDVIAVRECYRRMAFL